MTTNGPRAVTPESRTVIPLGIADISALDDHTWFWCRRHKQSVKVEEPCTAQDQVTYEFPLEDCIRIGPFMSEREANRLRGSRWDTRLGMQVIESLGMEVEQ